jgi:hypothetical protein
LRGTDVRGSGDAKELAYINIQAQGAFLIGTEGGTVRSMVI